MVSCQPFLRYFLHLLDAGFILCYIVYHISIIYIYFVTGGAAGCHFDNFCCTTLMADPFGFPEISVYIYVYM